MECVTVGGVQEHLTALQAIANDNGGNRASGLPGHTASADYVSDRLEAAGYRVTRQPFDFAYYDAGRHADVRSRSRPTPTTYVYGDRLPGHELLRLRAQSPARSSRSTSTRRDSGCEAADFTVRGRRPGRADQARDLRLRRQGGQRGGGGRTRRDHLQRRTATEERGPDDLIGGTLGAPRRHPGPRTSRTRCGVELATGSPTVAIDIETVNETRSTENVIAELPGQGRTTTWSASVPTSTRCTEGPGINDNGTRQRGDPRDRRATWPRSSPRTACASSGGAPRSRASSARSTTSTRSAAGEQLTKLALYLNFDMVGSPNFARFIYDGDGSNVRGPGRLRDGGVGGHRDAVRGRSTTRGAWRTRTPSSTAAATTRRSR